MARRGHGWWAVSFGVARALLGERGARRRVMMWFLVALLGMLALGLWGIDHHLNTPLRFLAWWGGCGLLAAFLVLFAVYDMCAVVREERARFLDRKWPAREIGPGSAESTGPRDPPAGG